MSNYDFRQKSHLWSLLNKSSDDNLKNWGDSNLCLQVQEEKRQEFLEAKRSQQLRANNEELRELERKLKCAYINKSLDLQKKEQHAMRMKEREELLKDYKDVEQTRKLELEIEETKLNIEKQRKDALRKDLLIQIDRNVESKQIKFKLFLEEKKRIDEIIKNIFEEELEAKLLIKAKKEQSRNFYYEFKKEKDSQLREIKLKNDEENKKIQDIISKRDLEDKLLRESKDLKLKHHELISQQLGTENYKNEQESLKRRNVMEDLLVEERNSKLEAKYRDEMENEIRKRILISISLNEHLIEKRTQTQYQLQEEKKKAIEESKRIQEQNDIHFKRENEKYLEQKRLRTLEVNQNLQLKSQEREDFVRKQIGFWEKDVQEESRRANIIENERVKILQEHAKKLIGYLPQGILKESDREFIELP